MSSSPLLEVKDLKMHFPVRQGLFSRIKGHVHAVDGVSLELYPGECLGLVGESGSGKSTLGRLILQLLEPTSGEVWYQGQKLTGLSFAQVMKLRKGIQMIFQDPLDSLNSRLTIGQIVAEPLEINQIGGKAERQRRVEELLELVGLEKSWMNRFPHEFSGGQRQRVGIARALALGPNLIVADEPVSALDVSIQAQILNLMKDLQEQLGLSFLFIAHDIHVIRFISHRVCVMYLGRLVEVAPAQALKDNPLHPYSQALLASVPWPDPARKQEFNAIQGEIPSLVKPPSGCSFHPRCPQAMGICSQVQPQLRRIDSTPERQVACHLYNQENPEGN